ncbi:unnamed protein product [Caenorhabditis brenneri]
MKKWRFFPILVKEEVLKNMDLSDRLSFSKCSKKCRNLLSRIPNHLESFTIPNDNQLSVDDFLLLFTSRISTLQELQVEIETLADKDKVIQFLKKLSEKMKVRKVVMKGYSQREFKMIMNSCDSSYCTTITNAPYGYLGGKSLPICHSLNPLDLGPFHTDDNLHLTIRLSFLEITMKKWRFFPILVKEKVLKNMDLSDRLSFSKCSKKCWNLVSRVPSHVKMFKTPSHDSYPVLIISRKSTIQNLIVNIYSPSDKYLADRFFEILFSEKRDFIKVTKLTMNINQEYSEMHKKFIDFCDPSFIESIEIEELDSQEVYEDILRTPQWKNSREVSLNWDFDGLLKVNINDFLHFKSIRLRMEELSADDAWKLVQNSVNAGSLNDRIDIRSQNFIQIDLIRQKIETELVGEWKGRYSDARYLVHPKNPNLVLEYAWYFNMFYVRLLTLEEFHREVDLL